MGVPLVARKKSMWRKLIEDPIFQEERKEWCDNDEIEEEDNDEVAEEEDDSHDDDGSGRGCS